MISKVFPVCNIQNYSHGTKGNHIGQNQKTDSLSWTICYSLNVYIDEHYFGTFEFVKAQNTWSFAQLSFLYLWQLVLTQKFWILSWK